LVESDIYADLKARKMNMIRVSLLSRFLITCVSIMAPSVIAMDKMNTPEALQISDPAKFCHLLRLPNDIKRYIALLAFEQESEKEFVERTRIQEQVPHLCYKNFFTPPNVGGKESLYSAVYCPYKTNIALLKLLSDTNESTITIIDVANNTLVHSEKLNQLTTHTAVAVSRDAAMFATIRQTTFGYRDVGKNNVAVLEVKNIGTQKIQEFNIPAMFPKISLIDFNKQGTQIIVHAPFNAIFIKDETTESNPAPSNFLKIHPMAPYKVFDLKTDVQGRITSEKSLEEHFELQMICKNLMKSL
jgi:hypothetical protein